MKIPMVLLLFFPIALFAAERSEKFDHDPDWDGHNNHALTPESRRIRQDFGYSPVSSNCLSGAGECGGFINPAAEPAYYARKIEPASFNDRLTASGNLVCPSPRFHVLLAFFNGQTLNEWRTPNSIALRLQGRGDVFNAYVEYATAKWRAGGDSPGGFPVVRDAASGRMRLKGFPIGRSVHAWSLSYDPDGNSGSGTVRVTLDGETATCNLDSGHKQDGAKFDRFGLLNVMKQWDQGGEIWLDDVSVNGTQELFDHDPHWIGFQNRRTYTSTIVRPRFDFGFSPTHFAGGEAPGEIGGLVFRGDGRYTNRMAFYGARLEELSLAKPLRAGGKICLRRAVTDSDVLFGFFHSEHSLESGGTDKNSTPPDFIGVAVGGPTREGFQLTPLYRLHGTEHGSAKQGPHIYPDGVPHAWSFEYDSHRIRVTLDGQEVALEVPAARRATGAHYNRFGLITTHTDGNSQHLYFDDLTYTWKQ